MPAPVDLPQHAYIPGKTARHPEGTFDAIRDTAAKGMGPDDLARSDAFRIGLHYLNSGFHWEAHELLEPVWMTLPSGGAERAVVQALIQFANAKLKVEMGRPKAAARLCGIVLGLLERVDRDVVMGIATEDLRARVETFERCLDE